MGLKEDGWRLCYCESIRASEKSMFRKKKGQLMLLPLADTIVLSFAVSL